MKWRIKNPAPTDDRQHKWGDFHFGRSLAAALRKRGQEVEMDFHPDWYQSAACDVVLVLRGKYRYEFGDHHGEASHLMWNISHPSDVTVDEYRGYEHVFIASNKRAEELRRAMPGRVHELLQCTDTEQFHPPATSEESLRRDLIFVGNTRSQRRELVVGLAEAGVRLRIWGRGWRDHELAAFVIDDYIENERLGALYRGARVCINDHWPDMIEHGFINNRVFDALACGLPVLSDQHPAINTVFGSNSGVVQTTPASAHPALAEMLIRYPLHLNNAYEMAERIRREHSFDARAEALIAAVS